MHQFLYWLQAACTAKQEESAVLARKSVCIAYEVRYDQIAYKTISVGPASQFSADQRNVQMLGRLAAALCHCESP